MESEMWFKSLCFQVCGGALGQVIESLWPSFLICKTEYYYHSPQKVVIGIIRDKNRKFWHIACAQ